ncbi:MAG: glycosyl hydrolase [Kiritimatiellia bacterium]
MASAPTSRTCRSPLAALAGEHRGRNSSPGSSTVGRAAARTGRTHAREFQRRRGYDLTPYLPVLAGRVLNDLQTTERFLFDLRLTVSELITENFWAEIRRLSHQQGMKLAAQVYITPGNDFDAANQVDEPMGECWAFPFQPNDYRLSVKAASDAATLNGRAIAGVEAFTGTTADRWQTHPATLKALADVIFSLGGNRLQVHCFAMQRIPAVAPRHDDGQVGHALRRHADLVGMDPPLARLSGALPVPAAPGPYRRRRARGRAGGTAAPLRGHRPARIQHDHLRPRHFPAPHGG